MTTNPQPPTEAEKLARICDDIYQGNANDPMDELLKDVAAVLRRQDAEIAEVKRSLKWAQVRAIRAEEMRDGAVAPR